jgi:hypothetical protein
VIHGILIQALILLIWFKTDAVLEYFSFIPGDPFKLTAYLTAKQSDVTLEYHLYLLLNHNNFFTRLITCPICLNVWLSILFNLYFTKSFIVPELCLPSLLIYYLLVKLM